MKNIKQIHRTVILLVWLIAAFFIYIFLLSHLFKNTKPNLQIENKTINNNYLAFQYIKEDGKIFYNIADNHGNIEVPADYDSFQSFDGTNENWAKDKNHVFFHYDIVDGINPSEFKVLNGDIVRDDKSVYWSDRIKYKILNGLDVTNTKIVENRFLTDGRTMYLLGYEEPVLIKGIDINTFSVIGDYIKDKSSVYYVGDLYNVVKFSNSDPSTFKILNTCAAVEKSGATYAIDKNQVYAGNTILTGADPKTFRIIASFVDGEDMPVMSSYATDGNRVWHSCGQFLDMADPTTFEYVGNGYAKDKNNVYGGVEYSFGVVKGVKPQQCTRDSIINCKGVAR